MGLFDVFRPQTYYGLQNAADITNDFGAEDKLLFCRNGSTTAQPQLVYPDLDATGALYVSPDLGATWSTLAIQALACPDPNQPLSPLVPRSTGYTVGLVPNNVTAQDRLIILGGDDDENNVYYSDDCGVTWLCYDGDQIWDPRDFAPIWTSPWDATTTWMGGGVSDGFMFSIGVWRSQGSGGIAWSRPVCNDTAQCVASDTFDDNNSTDWLLPTDPMLTGQVVPATKPDGTPVVYFFDADATFPVFEFTQAMDVAGIGPQQVPGSQTGGFGRKVFLRGGAPGSGCFFSTDFDAADLYFPLITPTNTNGVAVATSAAGPWESAGYAPWEPRAGAALVTTPDGTAALLASGLVFDANGNAVRALSDVWLINNTVCLLNGNNGEVCGGPAQGTPDLYNLVCVCNAAFNASRTCDAPSPSPSASASASASMTVGYSFSQTATATATGTSTASSSASASSTGTMFNETITSTGTSTATGTSTGTSSASASASVTATPSSSITGTPSSSVTPTPSPSQTATPPPSRTPAPTSTSSPSQSPAPPPPSGLDPGVAAGLGVGGALAAVAGALFVYGRFLGGGPVLSAAFAKLRGAGGGVGGGGGGANDRVGLLRPSAAASTGRLESLGLRGGGGGFNSYGASAPSHASGGDNPFAR